MRPDSFIILEQPTIFTIIINSREQFYAKDFNKI